MTDRRLAPVHAALAAGTVKVFSVDVFDTLLWRRVPEPADVGLLLGRKLSEEGVLAAGTTAVAFAELRRAAEAHARQRKQEATGYREIVLTDIYRALPSFVFRTGFDADAPAAAEFELERSLMIRDRAVAAAMAMAKAAGARVILVSDTYFTSAQVKTFLSKPGLVEGRDFDRLYVSCEAGRPKWRDLFDTVLQDMDVKPGEMLHLGDTLEADIWPCRLRGIACVQYEKWRFAPRAQTREMPADLKGRAARLGARGDAGLTGLRSRLFHAAPADLDTGLEPYWSYGAATLAPVFAAFARWIVAQCTALGAGTIYGIMREGRFLNRIVAQTATALNVPLRTEEIWLSRRAVVRAALTANDPGLLPEFAMLSPGRSTAEVLQEMGLTGEDLAGAGSAAFDITQDDALVRLCRQIGAAPQLMEKVLKVAARHRKHLLTALGRRWDLSATGPAVVMDLGYSATIQSVVQQVLHAESSPLKLVGLYVALNTKAAANLRAGADVRCYLDSEGFGGAIGKLLSRVPFVLEHACMCRDGSLSTFTADGEPVLLPNLRPETQLAQMEALQEGIVAGIAQINELLGGLDQTPADAPFLKEQVTAILKAAHLYPTAEEAATIGAWRHEAKIDFTGAHKLTDLSFDAPRLEYAGWPALQDIGLDQVYWPAAAFVGADPFIADAYAAGTENAYPAAQLTAGPVLGRVVICPDAGAGFDERRQGGMPLAVTAFGRAELHATIKPTGADAYHRLRLTWPAARAVIALDHLTVIYDGESERLVRDVLTPGTAAQVSWTNATAVAGTAMLAEPGAFCIVNLGPPPSWPHSVAVKLRIKYLRLDPMFGGRA